MVIDINETYGMMMKMMKMKLIITRPILKLQPNEMYRMMMTMMKMKLI